MNCRSTCSRVPVLQDKIHLQDTPANGFYAGERQDEERWLRASAKHTGSRHTRLGAGMAARCHLLSLVGTPAPGMPPAARSPCAPGQGRLRPGAGDCHASSASFGHQLDPDLGKPVLW